MSIFQYNQIINSEVYIQTWQDKLYNDLMGIIEDYGKSKDIINLAVHKEERGKDANCMWEEIYFFKTLADYFINMLDAFYHIECPQQSDIDALKLKYDLACIRKTALCRFNRVDLFDRMLVKLGLTIDGLNNMVQQLYDSSGCLKPFIVI